MKDSMTIPRIIAFVAAVLAWTGAQAAEDGAARAARAGEALVGQPAPAAVLRTLDGGTIDLAAHYGRKPVYLKFWATWCVPCREQMPGFERIYRQYGKRIDVVAVNVGFNETEDGIRAYRAQHGRPVLLDFYADWCVACREMEARTFSVPAVQARLAGVRLLRADVTAAGPAERALLKRFGLFGPPGTIFFDPRGQEVTQARVIGFQDAPAFLRTLDNLAANEPMRRAP
jgi:thiol:disulfide interchange protein